MRASIELHSSLQKGYARYQVVVAAAACAHRFLQPDEHPSRARDVAVGVLTAHAVASFTVSELAPSRSDAIAWLDAVASAVSSTAALVSGSAAGVQQGAWPSNTSKSVSAAQWASGGTSLLGSGGIGQVIRAAGIAAPYVVWPRGRRWLRASGLFGETTASLVVFAVSTHFMISALRSTARGIDVRADQVLNESEIVAARRQDTVIRDSVIAQTADRLRVIKSSLATDRALAAEQAADEEARLRAWLLEDFETQPAVEERPDVSSSLATAEGLERFLAVSESLLRASAAAQLLFEVASQRRSAAARALGALAGLHAAWVSRQLLGGATVDRRRIVASDLALHLLAVVVDIADTRRGWEPGRTHGFLQAHAAATGAADGGRRLTSIAMLGTSAISALGAAAGPADVRTRWVTAVERALVAGSLCWLTHWFGGLVGDQAEQLTETTEELAAVRASMAADAVRRNRQYFVHDSALQVLVGCQKSDFSLEQLDTWLGREISELESAIEGDGGRALRDLHLELDALIRGFQLLGLEPVVDVDESAAELPIPVVRCVVQVANEALANVLKHSEDQSPLVQLRRAPTHLELVVRNEVAPGAASAPRMEGTGSAATLDRAAGVGGTVEFARTSTRFTMRMVVPVEGPVGWPAPPGTDAAHTVRWWTRLSAGRSLLTRGPRGSACRSPR